MHIRACCNNGWIEQPIIKYYVKDGDWFRLRTEEEGTFTYQHLELFDGKIEINPEWKVSNEEIGKVYIIKSKENVK